MGREFQGDLVAKGQRFAVVVSRFNDLITSRLLEGSKDFLLRHGVAADAIDVVRVPGTFELPLAAQYMVSKGYAGVICLGAVIRGETPHHEYIAAEAAKGIAHVGLQSGVPVSFGVITADTLEQAVARAGTKQGNKGEEAARSALEMANLLASLDA